MASNHWPEIRCPALVIGHPGHELCVLEWVSHMRPLVHVLTDGSGHHEQGRADSTARILDSLRVPRSGIFATVSDRAVYQAIMHGRLSVFKNLLRDLAESFIANEIDFIVSDAMEGFNPTHDLCSVLAEEAACIAARATGRKICNYEIRLGRFERGQAEEHDAECLHLELDSDALKAKLEIALAYSELRNEVQNAIKNGGVDGFRIECLTRRRAGSPPFEGKPYYELVGERRVEEGIYNAVLRHAVHMGPVFEALRKEANRYPIS